MGVKRATKLGELESSTEDHGGDQEKQVKINSSNMNGGERLKISNLVGKLMKAENLRGLVSGGGKGSSSGLVQLKVMTLGVTTMLLSLWVFALQLASFGETISSTTVRYEAPSLTYFPPPRSYKRQGYMLISTNGGLNQMRAGICDMVTIARFLNLTLLIPQLDKSSFWRDDSRFGDIFDEDYFIKSLRDEVQIVKELPPRLKSKFKRVDPYSMPPISWSNLSYYYDRVLPRFQKYKVIQFSKTDSRLANNLPEEAQKLRCRVNYDALRFAEPIREVAKKLITILRQKGPFLVLHLRYEKDMLAFSGCTQGCTPQQVSQLSKLRYEVPWWKEKEIDPEAKRKAGLCPLTPEETALAFRAFEIDNNIQVYIAAGDIFGGEKRLKALRAFYPNLVKKETLLQPSDLMPFQNHSNQMAAIDYMVSLESDIFIPTYGGNMAQVVEGHRRYLGYKTTIRFDGVKLVNLIDEYKNGNLSWKAFSQSVKEGHANRMGGPIERVQIPEAPKKEDYFYSNPQECLPSFIKSPDDHDGSESTTKLILRRNILAS